MVQWLRLPCFHLRGGAGSIPGQGTKISRAIWHDREKKFKKRSVSCRSSGWADVSVLSLWAWLWLMTRAELWGAGVSGEVVHALWVPTLPGSPPTRSWCLGGGGVEVPCRRHPSLLAQPRASQWSHPRGLQSLSVGQMSRVGHCPALRALSARGSTREAAGPSEPGLCRDFFVQKWQKHLSLAYENQELTGIDHEKLDGCVPGPMLAGWVCPAELTTLSAGA